MIIRRGKQPLQSEIVWLYVSPPHRGKGTAQKALKAFKARLGQKHSLTPVDVLPEAEMFWWKMAERGITTFDYIKSLSEAY